MRRLSGRFCLQSTLLPQQTVAGFFTVQNFTNNISLFVQRLKALHDIHNGVIGDHNDHANAHIECVRHFVSGYVAALLQKRK